MTNGSAGVTSAPTPGRDLRVEFVLDGTVGGADGERRRPRFHDLCTVDGVPYEQIAGLSASGVLVSTVAAKSASELAEVAEAAVRLDGVRQMVLTAGSSGDPEHGALHLARCVRAVTAAVPGLPVRVQIEPPDDLASIGALHRAGAVAIGVPVHSLDDELRWRWMPGRATVPLSRYWAVWDEAVRIFGRNRVFTSLLLGLGEHPDQLVDAARLLIGRGIHPVIVPSCPVAGTVAAAEDLTAVAGVPAGVTARVAELLSAAEMREIDQHPGCVAYGACSVMAVAGG